jgi:hypothetical protein
VCYLKPNYLGIIGGILAFIALVLPWWVMSISSSVMGTAFSGELSVNLYQATATVMGISTTVSLNLWFGWTALVFVVIGGLLGLAGSLITSGRRMVLALGGILVLLSIIVFAAGLQNQISSGSLATGYPTGAGLFSGGSYTYLGTSINYSTYLSFGFWLPLVAAIIMFAALTRKPAEAIPSSQPSPPPPT